ncbi:alpha/beta hydrolase family protein [Streptomyces sp. LP05-1]|uniref:Alpha/beta hydrolase family protein n=1 Tax=Streptomyces pyxinae TaxID=2970734 RepID=A0ABT2CPT5_9ACTN|nr:alpha/beta hydrolase family protein [Streptomyces sp. LP05-1]MCS0639448.1 alpha/beta hydrolase family protein [Streptomyces sp. LP05-1]
MDFATLKTFKPAEYEQAATGYRAAGDAASAAKDAILDRISAGIRKQLTGKTANAALTELGELAKNFHYAQTECGLAAAALDGFAFDMAAAKRKLEAAIEDAAADGCTVNPDGSVSYPAGRKPGAEKDTEGGTVTGSSLPGTPTSDALDRQAANIHPNPYFGKAHAYADRVAEAVRDAGEADGRWAPKLRALKADDDLKVSDRDWADTRSDASGVQEAGKSYLDSLPQPPKDGAPKDNAAWWKKLSPEERAAWVSLRPDTVGGLDGLPSPVRDEANRMVLAGKQGEYQLKLDAIPPEPLHTYRMIPGANGIPVRIDNPEWIEWRNTYGARHDALQSSVDGMKSIQKRLGATGERGLPEAYLLGFSPEGNGRAIVANGNPDTAAHQAVYVPGTTSKLGSVGGDIDRMGNLWRVAAAQDKGPVSTITWLGYDAPQDIVFDSPFSHYANDGAPAYNRFMDGLDVSHTGDSEPHRTAIGHSYGTTLIGSAARQGDLNADDVVLAGSPGVQVPKAEQMDVPKGHVWNEEADGDPVPDIGRYGHGGTDWDGPWAIPSDQRFGAHQMDTDTEGHSDYWDENTLSLRNQAHVVVGQDDQVRMKAPPVNWGQLK